jgi:hypothetical protein
MIPYLLAAVGGYLLGDSIGEDIDKKIPEFAEGGIMAKGGMIEHGLKVEDKIINKLDDSSIVVENEFKDTFEVNLKKGTRKEMPFKYAMSDGEFKKGDSIIDTNFGDKWVIRDVGNNFGNYWLENDRTGRTMTYSITELHRSIRRGFFKVDKMADKKRLNKLINNEGKTH